MQFDNRIAVILEDRTDNRTLENDNFNSTEAIINERDPNGKRSEQTRLGRVDEGVRRVLDHPRIIHWICLLLLAGNLSVILYSLTDSFLPGKQLFGMFALFMTAYVAGKVAGAIKLPPLLGMLLMGILLRNVGGIHFTGKYASVTAILRHFALFVILTRAGLGVDPKAMKSLSFVIIRLAFGPAMVEVVVSMVVSYYLLGLPWIWGALLGAILCAVSPAVVIPCLFALQEKGYGTDKGIPTLVVAAASLDDIFSISVYGVVISIIFSPGSSLVVQLIRGPLGILMGIIFGMFWGVLLHYIPHKDDKNVVLFRVLMIAGGGLMIIYGSDVVGYPGAGPLGCIVAPVVANFGWKRDGWSLGSSPVAEVYGSVWIVFQPVLFGLIGAEVDVTVLEGQVVLYGLLALVCSIIIRILLTISIAFGGGFNWREKTFVAFAWFPKATVQAALGPIPLDKARENGNMEYIAHAEKILILAVLAILITAPLGATLITLLGPKLLSKNPDHELNQFNKKKNADNVSENDLGPT